MTPLRVLHVITMLELGGAQRNTLDTVASLDRRRFALGLACSEDGELVDEARTLPDTDLFLLPHLCRAVRPWHDIRALAELRATFRRFRPDVVHTHSSKAGILGRLGARLERVPITVHSIHGFGFGAHQPWYVRQAFLTAEKLVAHSTTAFIAVSQRDLDEGVRLGLFRAQQVRVIRSGIDLDAFRAHAGGAAVRRELMIPAAAPLVVQVACFKPQKAPERFVALAAALAAQVPDAHFLLVGDGALRPQLERLRTRTGLGERLHLPGWRRDMPAVLDAATVVTLTSRFEGLPRALVEALAASVPVVAMAVDGVAEVVRDGDNGFLVGEGDVSAMTARVAEILHNDGVRARLTRNAGTGLAEFDRRRMIVEQERLYEELACQTRLR